MRQLTRSRKWKHKEGRGTSHSYWSRTHGPRGLLTTHPGGVHGDGWSPGGGSSFRQGAGATSPGSPNLERQRWKYREEMGKRTSILGVSSTRAIYRRRGAPRGSTRDPGGSLALPRAATKAPGALVGPLLPSFGDSGSFLGVDFLYNFSGIFGAV